jgi:hypothetical protein
MSKPDDIKAAVVTLFQAMAGSSTYTYPPHGVYRSWGSWDDRILDPGLSGDKDVPTVVYGVRSEGKRHDEESSSQVMSCHMELLVLVARLVVDGVDDPTSAQPPLQDTIADALEADAVNALLSDVTLGGTVSNILVPGEGIQSENYTVLDEQLRPAWIARELRMTVQFSYVGASL